MKRLVLVLAVSVLTLLSLPGWGQETNHEQAKAAAAAHREEVRNNPDRPRHKRKHRKHHRHHNGA